MKPEEELVVEGALLDSLPMEQMIGVYVIG